MKQFNGFEDAQKSARYTGGAKLPKGAYVIKILSAKTTTSSWGEDQIAIAFDIAEANTRTSTKASSTGTLPKTKNGPLMRSII